MDLTMPNSVAMPNGVAMPNSVAMTGRVTPIKNPYLRRAPLSWRIKNIPNRLRGLAIDLARKAGLPVLAARLKVKVFTNDGRVVDYGVVSTRVVTTAFVNALVDTLQSPVSAFSDFKYHASGTNNTAESASDTTLGTEVEASRQVGTQAEGSSANIYQSVATIGYTASRAIVEHGLFNAASGGTLMDRSVFSPINVANGESIQFTYELTCSAGS